jgi:hypothetical protein
MITGQITDEIKKSLNGFDESKMYEYMLNHYKVLHLINKKGKWATLELEAIASELLPNNITEQKSKDFIDEMALLAERNPYLVNFLTTARSIKFEHLALKLEKEGKQLFPDVVAYSMVLELLTKAVYDNPKILKECFKIFNSQRHKSRVFRHMSLSHKIKLISVEYSVKSFLNCHKTNLIPEEFGRFTLTLNIIEAVVFDYIKGFRNNAKTGLTLAFHKTGSKKYNPLTGEGPSTWSSDKKAISFSMPMTKEWCDLYQTWNMAFVSQFHDFLYIIPKLLVPQVANYQGSPTSYMYKRVLALYLYLNYSSLSYAEKANTKEPAIQWNCVQLSCLWGKVNLRNVKLYKEKLLSVTLNNDN